MKKLRQLATLNLSVVQKSVKLTLPNGCSYRENLIQTERMDRKKHWLVPNTMINCIHVQLLNLWQRLCIQLCKES